MSVESLAWKCSCGGILDVEGTAIFDREKLDGRPMNFWRYRESFGFSEDTSCITLGETMTPLLRTRFRDWQVTFKLEYILPTGSYKDRGIAVSINHLALLGVRQVAEDSSGNAGASTAAYSAAAGIQSNIFVSSNTSPGKVAQARVYGARCHRIKGTRIDSALEAQKPMPETCYIGHSWNPMFACGIKSIAYEIAEQSGWRSPDWIVTPLGGGSLVLGLIDGFVDLLGAGYVQRMPRILAVQSAACAPVYEAWVNNKSEVSSVAPKPTIAEGVTLPSPPRGKQVLDAVRRNEGFVLAVNDAEVLACWRDLALSGVFVEPTSAVAVAGAWLGLEKYYGPEDDVCVLLTGHGLKTSLIHLDSE
jgi:threonine synthase